MGREIAIVFVFLSLPLAGYLAGRAHGRLEARRRRPYFRLPNETWRKHRQTPPDIDDFRGGLGV